MDDFTALWLAIQIIVSASVFSTGFLSVRIHASLDRAIGRADVLDKQIQTDPPHLGGDRSILRAVRRLDDIGHPDSVNNVTVWGNAVLFCFVLGLGVLIAIHEGWRSPCVLRLQAFPPIGCNGSALPAGFGHSLLLS